MRRLVGDDALRYDLTEIAGLDYLSSPSGVILQAQQLAAGAFGADHTWFLINGCSCGIHAAVLATAGPGDTLVLARNCHASAFSAMVLSGCSPLWVQPEADATHGVAHCVDPHALHATLEAAAAQRLRVKAVLVVSPTYYGAAARLSELADICHSHGVPLIVDEAHGAHFHFAPNSPPPALACGADVVIQSTHKVLSAMTQAAMLHLRGNRVDAARVINALRVVQSSSPSYLLLASLDAARQHAVDTRNWQQPIAAAAHARLGVQYIPGVTLLDASPVASNTAAQTTPPAAPVVQRIGLPNGTRGVDAAGRQDATVAGSSSAAERGSASAREPSMAAVYGVAGTSGSCSGSPALASVAGFDPLRLVINVSELGLTGFEAAEWMEQRHHIVPELATAKLVVLVFGPGSVLRHGQAVVEAMTQLAAPAALLSADKPAVDAVDAAGAEDCPCPRRPANGSNVHQNAARGSTSSNHHNTTELGMGTTELRSRPCSSNSSSDGGGGNMTTSMSTNASVDAGARGGVVVPDAAAPRSAADCDAADAQPSLNPAALTPREAFFATTEAVALAASLGRVSAELLCPYPPGVPVVFPGEILTAAAVQQLVDTIAAGGVVTGADDGTLTTVRVITG